MNEELPAVKWFQPSAAPSGAWKLFLGSDVAAARAAAWDAARDAAWDAAWAAAWACNFQSIVHDLDIDQKHRDHVASRWSAWTSGYGVSCDVDGVLYCYATGEWLSVEAVSDKLKASSAAVKNYCAAGLIPHAKLVKESRGDVWQIPSVGLIGFEKPKRGGANK